MTKTTLYLIRHGQTEWNLEQKLQGHMDSPLTLDGRSQAASLRERLKNARFDGVFSSTSPRAVMTAQIVSDWQEGSIQQLDDLKEIHMGLWEGQSISKIQRDYPDQMKHFIEAPHLYRPTGAGETYQELLKRAVRSIEGIISSCNGGTVLIVTHRMTLKTIMNYYSGKALKEMGAVADIPPASLSKISIHDSHPCIELYGDTTHYEMSAKA